jgi:hypothetical protein
MGLCALLAAVTDRHPERIAFVDQAGKPAWCGRPAIAWTFAAASVAGSTSWSVSA